MAKKAKTKAQPKITDPLTDEEIRSMRQQIIFAAAINGPGEEPYVSLPVRLVLRLALTGPIPWEKLK